MSTESAPKKKPWFKNPKVLALIGVGVGGVVLVYMLVFQKRGGSSPTVTAVPSSGSGSVPSSSASGSGSSLGQMHTSTLEGILSNQQDALMQAILAGNQKQQAALQQQISQLEQQLASHQATSGGSSGTGAGSSASPSGMVTVAQSASPLERLKALANNAWVSLPGVKAAQVGSEKQYAAHTQAIGGVLSNGVAQLNRHAPWSQQESLLASSNPVSIPGVSAAQMGYLKSLAKQGKLAGIGPNGHAIMKG